jgi:hypothetical protein
MEVAQRIAMELMRHSDIKLTAKVHTDETQLPVYEAIKAFLGLGGVHEYAHRILAKAVKTWRSLSQPVKGGEVMKSL